MFVVVSCCELSHVVVVVVVVAVAVVVADVAVTIVLGSACIIHSIIVPVSYSLYAEAVSCVICCQVSMYQGAGSCR